MSGKQERLCQPLWADVAAPGQESEGRAVALGKPWKAGLERGQQRPGHTELIDGAPETRQIRVGGGHVVGSAAERCEGVDDERGLTDASQRRCA